MSDTTSVYLEVLESGRAAVIEAFGEPDDEDHQEPEGTRAVLLTFNDVNYGGLDLLADVARSGLAFRGWHDDGCNYHGMTFAACDGILAEAPSPHGELMVRIDPTTLEPNAEDLAAVRRWRETEDRVLARFAAEAPPPPPAP